MPTPPRTWAAGDRPSPTYLNNDLYARGSAYFVPNGIRFHARKPLYKSFPNGAVSYPATSWQYAFSGVLAVPQADSSADYGNHMDPAFWGGIQSNVPDTTGAAGGFGGWYLMSAFIPIASGADNVLYAAAIAANAGGAGSGPFGTHQRGNTAHNACPFVLDLVSMGSGTSWTPMGFNGHGVALNSTPSSDGTAQCTKWQAHWACSLTGTTVTAPAPKATWAPTDTVTASFMNGNTGVRDILSYLNFPPALRRHDAGGQSVANVTNTVINLSVGDLDSYSGFSGTTYTVQRDGIYLVHGYIAWSSSTAGERQTSLRINGTDYWGPATLPPTSANVATSTKTQVFSLNAGDTIQLVGWQNTGGALTTTTATNATPRLVVAWLSNKGVPSPLPSPPDPTYRYLAGTPGPLDPVLQAHVANDLSFLSFRPYLLAYQAAAQSITVNTQTQLNMDTVAGLVHADTGDSYSGWDATNHQYVAPVNGWYIFCLEALMALPSLTTSPSNSALMQITNNGTLTGPWDSYQELFSSINQGCAGATAIGYYYLRAGDAIRPGVITQDTTATTINTSVAAGRQCHFECVWVSE